MPLKQPQQKGKQGTKGAKQIVEENATTLKFYRNMAMGTTAVYVVLVALLFEFTGLCIVSVQYSFDCIAVGKKTNN